MDSDSDATYCSDVENRTTACSTKRPRKKPDYFKSPPTSNIEKLQETVNHAIGQNPEREVMAVLLDEAKKKKAKNLRDKQILSEVTQKLNNFFIGTQEISSGQEPINILQKADLTELPPGCATDSNDSISKPPQQALTHHIPSNDQGVKKAIRSKTTVPKSTKSKAYTSLCGKSEQIVATMEINDSMEKMNIAECDEHTQSSQMQTRMNIKNKRVKKLHDKSQTKIKTFYNLIAHDHCYSQHTDCNTEAKSTKTVELKSSPVDKESAAFTNSQTKSEYSLVPGCSRNATEAAKPMNQSKNNKNKKRKCEQLSYNKSQTKISDYYMQEDSNIQTDETIKVNDEIAPEDDIKRSEDVTAENDNQVENDIKVENIFNSLPSMEVIEQELQEAAEMMTTVMDDFLASIKNLKQDISQKRALQAAAAAETNEFKYPVVDSKYKKKEGLPDGLPSPSQFTITEEEQLPNLAFCNETVIYYKNKYNIPDLSDFDENI